MFSELKSTNFYRSLKPKKLIKILNEQDEEKRDIYTISSGQYGSTVVNDESGLVLHKPLVIEHGMTLRTDTTITFNNTLTNNGMIVNGRKSKTACLFVGASFLNNGNVENHGIMIINAKGHMVQTNQGCVTNNGQFDIDGILDNGGIVKNSGSIKNTGSIVNYDEQYIANSRTGTFVNKGRFTVESSKRIKPKLIDVPSSKPTVSKSRDKS